MMSDNKKAAMLYLEPKNDIVFEGPFNRLVKKSIVIENPRKVQNVAFKLKTTTPHLFLVLPSSGVLGPGEKVTVDVFLKPLVEDVGQICPLFSIQAAVVLGGNMDLAKFWKTQNSAIWNTQNSAIWKAKIKCVLIPHKSTEDLLREAGATATGSQNRKEDMTARRRKPIMQDPHPRNMIGCFLFFMILAIVASIVGAYYGMLTFCNA